MSYSAVLRMRLKLDVNRGFFITQHSHIRQQKQDWLSLARHTQQVAAVVSY